MAGHAFDERALDLLPSPGDAVTSMTSVCALARVASRSDGSCA